MTGNFLYFILFKLKANLIVATMDHTGYFLISDSFVGGRFLDIEMKLIFSFS